MKDNELLKLGSDILNYCKKYNIPLEFLFEILDDQKVTPMIRGKAMEYNAFLLFDKILPKNIWSVQKLNLNAQQGIYDEDISVTHRRTGIILKVESKSAVRGSINSGKRSKIKKLPYFKVKCHRSRSNIKLAKSSNDRYSIESFDVLVTNPSNAIFQGKTIGENLEIIYDEDLKLLLYKFYNVNNDNDLIMNCFNDWRFCIPKDIAIDGFIPRTPYVYLDNDPNWSQIANLEQKLEQVIKENSRTSGQPKRRN